MVDPYFSILAFILLLFPIFVIFIIIAAWYYASYALPEVRGRHKDYSKGRAILTAIIKSVEISGGILLSFLMSFLFLIFMAF